MHWYKKLSGAAILVTVVLLMLMGSASAARLCQIQSVEVKALADRDLVVFQVSRDVQPETAIKLYPTRLEAQFPGAELSTVSPQVKGTTLVKNVLVAGDTDTVVMVAYLDVKGKLSSEGYRWSRPAAGLLVLEVFYPLSSRSELTLAMLKGEQQPPAPEAAPPAEAEPEAAVPEAPVAPVEEPAPAAPAPAAAANVITTVYYDTSDYTLTIQGENPLVYSLVTSKFPPSLEIKLPDASLAPTIDALVAKNLGAIRDVRTFSLADETGCTSRVVVGFLNSLNIRYEHAVSDGGRTLRIVFPEARNVLLPEPSVPAAAAATELASAVPEPPPSVEPPPAPASERSFSAGAEMPSAGAVTYVNYDPSAMTLSVRTSTETTAHVVPIEFPRGYNILLDLPPSEAVTDYIYKNDPVVRNLTVSEVAVGDETSTRIILSFTNDAAYGFDRTGTMTGRSFELKLVPGELTKRQPAPAAPVEALTRGSELPVDGESASSPADELPSVDEVFAESIETDEDYPRMEVTATAPTGDYELPGFEEFEGKLSDVLVNLNAATSASGHWDW